MNRDIIAIRKRGGLDHIQVDKGGHKVRPEIYYQKFKDFGSDGVPQGEYREGMILDAKHFLAPIWDDSRKQWPWGGTEEELAVLIEKMKLKYEGDHPQVGRFIKPDNVADRIKDFNDPVFRHSSFYGKYYMQDSRGKFDLSDPKQKFMYLLYKGSNQAVDRSENKIISKYVSGASYELISPKSESRKKVKGALKEIEAKKFIGELYGDEAKIRAICEAMDLAAYRPEVDVEAAWLMLDEESQDTRKSTRYGKTHQDMFLELAQMEDGDLDLYAKVTRARKRGHIRKWQEYFTFDGEKIHVQTTPKLVDYFKNPEHQEMLIKLTHLLESDER